MASLYISPGDGGTGKLGGGPDDPTRGPEFIIRSQGFLMLAFGIAMGLTFMLFFGVFRLFDSLIKDFAGLHAFVTAASLNPNLWIAFLYGFVGGTVLSAIYNLLVVRRFNLLGLESVLD